MRVHRRWLFVLSAAWLAAAPTASAAPFTATLWIQTPYAVFQFSGSGTGTSNGASVLLPAGFVSGQQTAILPNTLIPPYTQIMVKAENGAASFTGSPAQGVMPVSGRLGLLGFGGFNLFFGNLGIFTVAGTRGFGIGGSPIHGAASGINMTAIGAPWTAGTMTVMADGVTHVLQGSDLRTSGGLGSLTLVTPFLVSTNLGGLMIPIFGTLEVTFVPEPGTLTLLAGGVAALGLRGARRRRVLGAAQR